MSARHVRIRQLLAVFWLLALFAPTFAAAQITITLKNSFIEEYRNRATIAADFLVDKAHRRPNPQPKDGDLHVAGRADEIGLPIVAELMNARSDMESVEVLRGREGTGQSLAVEGVWRLWCEHAGTEEQIQGAPLTPFTTTNPDHVFEIHPVTKVGAKDTRATFGPIEDFRYKDAEQAFAHYENVRATITPRALTTTITTFMAGFNYVEFKIEPELDKIIERPDGRTVLAAVRAVEGHMIARRRRMVFVDGTAPEARLLALQPGECMHVLGVPRISLQLVHWRKSAEGRRRGALTWNLPYEMVVVGLLSDSRVCEED